LNLPAADVWQGLAGALACAAVGSVFATMDAALSSLSPGRLSALHEQSVGISRVALDRYQRSPSRQHSRWLVGRVVFMGLASVLIAEAVTPFVPGWSVALLGALGAVATYGTLAEVGINLARRRADDFTLRFLPFIGLLELIVLPLAAPIALLGRCAARLVAHEPPPDARLTETEVEWVVAEGQKHGSLGREPAEMIRNVLELKDLVVRDVMVPRTRVSAIEVTRPIPEVLKIVASEGHSRFPVYRDKVDNIVGLLYAKDLFRILKDVKLQARPLIDLVRAPVNFVPETQGVSSVLREMRSRRLHMAVVIDEFGGVSGIVTLEDILEVIVGEIRDEYDTEEAPIQDLGDGRLLVDAAVSVDDLSAYLGAKIPEDGDYESLGGLLVHRAGKVPDIGTQIEAFDFFFIVREADEKRIIKVEIVRPRGLSEVPPPLLGESESLGLRRPSKAPAPTSVAPAGSVPAGSATKAAGSAGSPAASDDANADNDDAKAASADPGAQRADEAPPEARKIASAAP
jgi:CBS domain containing-hemolysin-like protein